MKHPNAIGDIIY